MVNLGPRSWLSRDSFHTRVKGKHQLFTLFPASPSEELTVADPVWVTVQLAASPISDLLARPIPYTTFDVVAGTLHIGS